MIIVIKPPNFNVAELAISENALRIHYEQHYLKYVKNTQALTKDYPWNKLSTADIIKITDPKYELHNNVAQVYNHEFFFEQFTANPSKLKDCSRLTEFLGLDYAILEDSNHYFIEDILEKTVSAFGSGYLWIWQSSKEFKLQIECLTNAETPLKYPGKINPILCIDLWEHSYYLDYQSDRKKYVENVLNAIDWRVMEERLM